jgi:hypothetical protein
MSHCIIVSQGLDMVIMVSFENAWTVKQKSGMRSSPSENQR